MVDKPRSGVPDDEDEEPDDELEALQDQYVREYEREDRDRRDRGYY